jgi:hypothetical protein
LPETWNEDTDDQKIWDSGLALAAWLRKRLGMLQAGDLDEGLAECLGLFNGQKGTRRILELGKSI